MSQVDQERQLRAEELLLRSARLDAPRADRRARVLARVLVEAHSRDTNRRLQTLGLVAAGLAVAAGVALFAHGKLQPSLQQVRPEAPQAARAPGPPASLSVTAAVALAPCPKLVVAKGGAPMIDDWEDRNARLLIADGREGTWMVYNDGSGKQVPPGMSPMHPVQLVPARGRSHYALHTSGEKLSIWGSTVVGLFTDGGCYDMSTYRGVAFWAKGNTRVYAKLAVIDEISTENGGLCAGTACNTSPSKAFDLGPRWQEYVLTFAELELLNVPSSFRFDPKRVTAFHLSIRREDTPFDVWMDDVRFIESE